jgi:hypothetical protein
MYRQCILHGALLETAVCFSYGPDFADIFRRSASYVDRILRGATPADLSLAIEIDQVPSDSIKV